MTYTDNAYESTQEKCADDATFRLELDGWTGADGGVQSNMEGYNAYDYLDLDVEYSTEAAAVAAINSVKADRDGVMPVLTIRTSDDVD